MGRSDILVSFLPSVPVWGIALLAGLITFVVGLLAGALYPGGGKGTPGARDGAPRSTPATAAPAAFRPLRALSGPLSGTVAGAAVGFYLGGIYGAFLGYPLAGLGFGIGLGWRAGSEWDYWRATFLAGWIGSWVSSVLLYATRADLPSSLGRLLGSQGTYLGFPLTTVAVGGIVGFVLSWLTTVDQGWTVGFVSGSEAAAGALAAGVVWLGAVLGLFLWSFGSIGTLASFVRWIVGYTPFGPAGAWGGRILAIELGAFVSLLLAAIVIPRSLTARRQSRSGDKPDLEYPTAVRGVWRLAPGACMGLLFAFTGASAFAGETGTYLGSVANLGALLAGATFVGAVLNLAMTRPHLPAPSPGTAPPSPPVAFFQTVGGLLYGIVTGIAAWGAVFVGLILYAGGPSEPDLVLGLVVGLLLAAELIVLFLGVDRLTARRS